MITINECDEPCKCVVNYHESGVELFVIDDDVSAIREAFKAISNMIDNKVMVEKYIDKNLNGDVTSLLAKNGLVWLAHYCCKLNNLKKLTALDFPKSRGEYLWLFDQIKSSSKFAILLDIYHKGGSLYPGLQVWEEIRKKYPEFDSRLIAQFTVGGGLKELRAKNIEQIDKASIHDSNHRPLEDWWNSSVLPACNLSGDGSISRLTSNSDLEAYLSELADNHWKGDIGEKGTGRSGNSLVLVNWKGDDVLMKISLDTEDLASEARQLQELNRKAKELSVAKVLPDGEAEISSGEYRWRAYLIEKVGKTSLRDYLFSPAPQPNLVLNDLLDGLGELYVSNKLDPPEQGFVKGYIDQSLESLRVLKRHSSFQHLQETFDNQVYLKNGVVIPGPESELVEWKGKEDDLIDLEPMYQTYVHGDLHFENIRIDPDLQEGNYWLIDPKSFQKHDWIYDLAKILTSLTGHAHADRNINLDELNLPTMENGKIFFECLVTSQQKKAWSAALRTIERWANGVAEELEKDCGEHDNFAWKKRLLLALSRHYFSTAKYFQQRELKWLLYARGAQFLGMFRKAQNGEELETWDPFLVCKGIDWLEETP